MIRLLVIPCLFVLAACQSPDVIIVTATPDPTATAIVTASPTPTTQVATPTLSPGITPTPQPSPTREVALSVYVHAEGLRLRTQPSTATGVILGELTRNTELYTLDTGAALIVGQVDQWLNVTTPDNEIGYVAAWLVGLAPLELHEMARYFVPDSPMSPIHTLRTSWAGDGERVQVQREGVCFWFVKGHQPHDANYEAFVLGDAGIYRTYDTSPFEGALYGVRGDFTPLLWLRANMAIGERVLFPMTANWRHKSDGRPFVPPNAPSHIIPFTHFIELVAQYEHWASPHGVSLRDVIEVRSYFPNGQPFERYWFSADARAVGLVGWKSETAEYASFISGILPDGTPPMRRERLGNWLQLPYDC